MRLFFGKIGGLQSMSVFENNVNFKHQLINIKQRIKDQNLQNQNSKIEIV
jgi:hypothetical protein